MGMPNSSFSLRQPGGRFLLLMIKNASCHVVLDKERRPLLNAVAPFHHLVRPCAVRVWHNRRFAERRSVSTSDFNPLVQGELFHGGV